MADLYLDENVTPKAVASLQQLGHTAVHARHVRKGAPDYRQLLVAASQARTLVTADLGYVLLHNVWLHWPRGWGLADLPEHSGILLVPNGWAPARLAPAVHDFFQHGYPTTNRLYRWSPTGSRWEYVSPDPP